jgi:mRNA interferase RelE/StbE
MGSSHTATTKSADEPSSRYEIFYDDAACKDLDPLPEKQYQPLDKAIIELGANPRPNGSTKLHDHVYRVRVGSWRIIYIVDDENRRMVVSRVKRRNERTYKGI